MSQAVRAVRDEWDNLSVRYAPAADIGNTAGIFVLYRGNILKFIGYGEVCAHRIEHYRTAARRYFDNAECHDWDIARIQPLAESEKATSRRYRASWTTTLRRARPSTRMTPPRTRAWISARDGQALGSRVRPGQGAHQRRRELLGHAQARLPGHVPQALGQAPTTLHRRVRRATQRPRAGHARPDGSRRRRDDRSAANVQGSNRRQRAIGLAR